MKNNFHQSPVPFAGPNGESLVRKLRQQIERKSSNLKIRVTYTPTKLGSRFVVKDKTKNECLHNVVYHVKCGNKKCKSCYVGQTKCRIIKRTLQHNSKDNASHVLIHSKATKHRRVSMENVKILGRRYKSDFKRRISESLFIKQLKPDLNKQKASWNCIISINIGTRIFDVRCDGFHCNACYMHEFQRFSITVPVDGWLRTAEISNKEKMFGKLLVIHFLIRLLAQKHLFKS